MIIRLYGPLEAWFNQTWRPGEIEPYNDEFGEVEKLVWPYGSNSEFSLLCCVCYPTHLS